MFAKFSGTEQLAEIGEVEATLLAKGKDLMASSNKVGPEEVLQLVEITNPLLTLDLWVYVSPCVWLNLSWTTNPNYLLGVCCMAK